jgi:hypothetical protein
MNKDWMPPGHSFSYRVDEKLDGNAISYDLSLPGRCSTVDLSTVRVGRHGGSVPEDLAFREDLFRLVGSITVTGGHVEAAMKRILLVLTEAETIFGLVDYQWADLEKKLRSPCDDADDRHHRLRRVLDWADTHDLREQRNTVVHGA